MSKAKGAAPAAAAAAEPEGNPHVRLDIEEAGGEAPTELVFELLKTLAPKGAEHFRQLALGATTADKKNPKPIGYAGTVLFRATDYMVQGGDTSALAASLTEHPPQGYKGQDTTFGALFDDEHVWDTFEGKDAFPEECFAELDVKDVEAVKKACLEKGCGGFSVKGGKARLRRRTARECCSSLAEAADSTFYSYGFGPSAVHHGYGTLSLANSGPDTNGSQFIITTRQCPWLDSRHTVIGRLVSGDLEGLHSRMHASCDPKTFLTPSPQSFVLQQCVQLEQEAAA